MTRGRRAAASGSVVLVMICLTGGGCSLGTEATLAPFGPADPETPVVKKPLPGNPPAPHRLEFADVNDVGHVKPQADAAAATASVKRTAGPVVFTAEQIGRLRQAAEANPRVGAMLGERWAFIEADRLLGEGKASFGCCRNAFEHARLLYFSYSRNTAVEVQMKDMTVTAVSRREGYIPPEGEQDVRHAADLARADDRLSGKVSGLEGHGIMMEPRRGVIWNDPGYGHRVMWVTFSQGLDGDPKFWAVVDLTDEKVLDAGEEPPR